MATLGYEKSNLISEKPHVLKHGDGRTGSGNLSGWAWETCLTILAVLDLLALALVLKMWENRRLQEWTSSVSLNAVIAVLVTFLYFFLHVPIGSCLGQIKWNHFAHAHRLYDYHVFEYASRSIWGAVTLIVRKPKAILGVSGSVLVVAIAAIGPFTQQIIDIQLVEQSTTTPNVALPVATSFDENSLSQAMAPSFASVLTSVLPNRPLNFTVDSTCPSSNCTWDPYFTLAAQSKCANVTSQLKPLQDVWTNMDIFPLNGSILPNGLYGFDGHFDYFTNLSSMPWSLTYGNESGIIIGFTAFIGGQASARSDGKPSQGPVYAEAWDCILQLVGQHYNASTHDGIFEETAYGPAVSPQTCSVWPDPAILQEIGDLEADPTVNLTREEAYGKYNETEDSPWFCKVNHTYSIRSDLTGRTVTFGGTALQDLSGLLMPVFNGSAFSVVGKDEATAQYFNDISAKLMANFALFSGVHTVPQRMDNVARGFSNYLRSRQQRDNASQIASVSGAAVLQVPVYRVRWGWMALPVILVAGTVALLLATIVATKRTGMPIWTQTGLAALLHGPIDDADKLANAERSRDMDRVAKAVVVQMNPTSRRLEVQ